MRRPREVKSCGCRIRQGRVEVQAWISSHVRGRAPEERATQRARVELGRVQAKLCALASTGLVRGRARARVCACAFECVGMQALVSVRVHARA
eukprot:6209399-Pleurochrysis_carterae.AAC.2